MAITVTVTKPENHLQLATYVGDASGGNGGAFSPGPWSYGLTVQRVSGTGTYTVEGSQDGATWGALSTPLAAVDDNALHAIVNVPRYLRVVTASAAATVIISGVGP